MPYFNEYVDVDITVEEFYDACSTQELEALKNLFKKDNVNIIDQEDVTIMDSEWSEALLKLSTGRLQLSLEDADIVKQIAKKVI